MVCHLKGALGVKMYIISTTGEVQTSANSHGPAEELQYCKVVLKQQQQ